MEVTTGGGKSQMLQLDDLMARLQRLMHMQSAETGCGMTATQTFILRFLDKSTQVKASDIAKVAGLSPGAVTQVCDELVRLGFVERHRSVDDRRVVYIAITPSGRTQLEEVRNARVRRLYSVIEQLGEEDAASFIRVLGRVVDIVERNAAERG